MEPSPLGDLLVPFGSDAYPHYAPDWGFQYWSPEIQPYGSGCAPGTATTLPDGTWFGYVQRWASDSIDFDLACVQDRPVDEWDAGGPWVITNDNTRVRTLALDPAAQYVLPAHGSIGLAYSFAKVVEARPTIGLPETSTASWIYVNGGVVTQVEAWVGDIDDRIYTEGAPWIPWGPESAPITTWAYGPEVVPPGTDAPDDAQWQYWANRDGETAPDGALGSGCSPGDDKSLPDGVWYGHVTHWAVGEISFDLACQWPYNSPQADKICGEAEWCDNPVSNESDRVRVLPLDPRAQFLNQESSMGAISAQAVIGVAPEFRPNGWADWLWIYVNDGKVTQFHRDWES